MTTTMTTTTRIRKLFSSPIAIASLLALAGANAAPTWFQAQGGNVGIGTTRPRYTLDVAGTVWAKDLKLEGQRVLG